MGLGRSLYFSGMGSVLKFALQFGLSIFVARALTPEEIGSFGVALAAAAFVRAFESAGINNFVASYSNLDTPLMRSIFTVNAMLNFGIALLLWLLAAPLGVFFDSQNVELIVEITAVATALNTHLPLQQGLFRRQMRFGGLMIFELFLVIVGGVATIIGVLNGLGPIAMALALVSEKIASIFLAFFVYRREIPIRPRLKQARVILDYGLSLSTATVIGMVGNHSSNFILGKILGLAPSAQFDRAQTLPRLIWGFVLPSFNNVLVPGVARHNEEEKRRATIESTLLLLMMILWPAATVLTLVAPDVVVTLFGYQWWEASELAPYLIVYSVLVCPITLACAGLVALGQGGAMIKIQIAEQGTRILILLSAFFVDLKMLTILMAIPYIAYSFVAIRYLTRHKLIQIQSLVGVLHRPLRVSFLCAVPVLIGRYMIGLDAYFTLEQLIVLAVVSTFTFVACLKGIEPHIFDRALEVAGLSKSQKTDTNSQA